MLKHFITVSSQKNLDNSFDKFDVLSVSGKYGIVNQIKFQGRSLAGKTLTNYKVVNTNDVVYTKSPIKNNPYGVIKVNKHKSGIVSTLYAVYNPTKYVCSNFVELYFNDNLRLNKYLKPIVNIGAKHDMKIANKEVINHNVIFPEVEEQRQICTLFLKLEKLISLQQRKLEQLKSIKKAMLQKLFVNKDMPILHFKGFNNIWKRSKLGNITKTISSKPYISGAYEEGKYEVVQQGDHPIAGYSNDIPFKNYKDVTLFGDHTLSLFKPRKAFLIASDGIKILSPSVTMDSLFYYYLLEKYKPRSEGYKRHFSILKKSVALFPVSINEQTQIAHVLIIIDKTISLQQERIEKLRNYKQFLLQNMLI